MEPTAPLQYAVYPGIEGPMRCQYPVAPVRLTVGSSECWLCSATTSLCSHHPSLHCAHIHCLFSISVQQGLINVSGCHFATQRNSVTFLCFIRTFVLDAVLSNCTKNTNMKNKMCVIPWLFSVPPFIRTNWDNLCRHNFLVMMSREYVLNGFSVI